MRRLLGVIVLVLGVWALIVYTGRRGGTDLGREQVTPAEPQRQAAAGDARGLIGAWPEQSREIAERMLERYGEPADVTNERLTWHDSGPWRRTIVHRDGGERALEQVALHPVPPERAGEVQRLEGARVEAGLNELSVSSDREQINFLTANLAHEILTGAKDAAQAQRDYARERAFALAGRSSPYLEGLLFDEQGQSRGQEGQQRGRQQQQQQRR